MSPLPAPLRHSLSTRLFRLTIVIVLVVEVLVFVPELAHERLQWLHERLDDTRIALLAAGSRPDQPIDPAITAELLRRSGTDSIRLQRPGHPAVVLTGSEPMAPDQTIVLRHEDFVMRTLRALRALAIDRPSRTRVLDNSGAPPGTRIEFVYRAHQETKALRRFARDFVWVSLAVACMTGALVYVAASVLLVRPMRQLIGSIAAFRAAPERCLPLDPRNVGPLASDEMAMAGRELAAMQEELRDALWRNARLAALGSAVARISHDLRGILAPALLTAERLQNHQDAAVQRAGDILVRTVDRATDLVRRTLDFAREGPPPLDLAPVELAVLVDEASEAVRAPGRPFAVVNRVPPALLIEADRNQFFRVLANLLRNAADAGARSALVSAEAGRGTVTIDVADDGPGLPDAARAALFRPFVRSTRHDGAGLGLAIARDLTLAHGGEITLASSGPAGTVFRLTLRAAQPPEAKDRDGKCQDPKDRTTPAHGIAPAAGADV
ncbi:MAG TPA: HAMP domain-containing sensor histidine kinase [Acetobacteraceae bacterium]|nr:HAMP domain-containing sensor histidine kinase [Acetobacteraceae bacterium]